jgi:hypothetical protein
MTTFQTIMLVIGILKLLVVLWIADNLWAIRRAKRDHLAGKHDHCGPAMSCRGGYWG